jgi:hypothetical protein
MSIIVILHSMIVIAELIDAKESNALHKKANRNDVMRKRSLLSDGVLRQRGFQNITKTKGAESNGVQCIFEICRVFI